jgi:hypothetical protein
MAKRQGQFIVIGLLRSGPYGKKSPNKNHCSSRECERLNVIHLLGGTMS